MINALIESSNCSGTVEIFASLRAVLFCTFSPIEVIRLYGLVRFIASRILLRFGSSGPEGFGGPNLLLSVLTILNQRLFDKSYVGDCRNDSSNPAVMDHWNIARYRECDGSKMRTEGHCRAGNGPAGKQHIKRIPRLQPVAHVVVEPDGCPETCTKRAQVFVNQLGIRKNETHICALAEIVPRGFPVWTDSHTSS